MQTSMHILSYVRDYLCSPITRSRVAGIMYCMDAQNEGSEASRTHFRACKDSNFPGGVPPDYPPPPPPPSLLSLPQSTLWGLLFVFALGPCNLRILRMCNTISRLRRLSDCAEHTSSYSLVQKSRLLIWHNRKHYTVTRPFIVVWRQACVHLALQIQ